jgi:hypothetical protein
MEIREYMHRYAIQSSYFALAHNHINKATS